MSITVNVLQFERHQPRCQTSQVFSYRVFFNHPDLIHHAAKAGLMTKAKSAFIPIGNTAIRTGGGDAGNIDVNIPNNRSDLTLIDRKSTRLNSSHIPLSRMPSS